MIKVLTFTTLYPSSGQFTHGLFVEQRLRHLVDAGNVSAVVIAPVPWFPFRHRRFGRYAEFAGVPRQERRHGIEVLHPRFPAVPKLSVWIAPLLMAMSARGAVRRLIASGYDFALIDAHYFYPDGVAAVMLARWFDKPVVITARGTDVNQIPSYRVPRRLIQWAARRADRIVTVCAALKSALVKLDVPGEKISVLRNGIDLELFRPLNRAAARSHLRLARPTLLSVGSLRRLKGNHLTIRALASLDGIELVIVGAGEEERALKRLAEQLEVSDRVRFVGSVPQDRLAEYYSAADLLVLVSSSEGWANVLLESMACGTPVVATDVSGTPEVVASPEAGALVPQRTPEAIAASIIRLLANYPDRAATRRYAEKFGWEETTRGQELLFTSILDERDADRRMRVVESRKAW